VLKNWVFIMV